MRNQRALGVTGSAAGVDQDGRCLSARADQLKLVTGASKRKLVSYIGQGCGLSVNPDTDHLAQIRATGTHRLHMGQGLGVADRHHGLTVLQTELQRLRAKKLRQWHGHGTHLQHGHVGHRSLKTLRQDNGHPVPRQHPQTGQHIGQAVGLSLQLGKRIGTIGLTRLTAMNCHPCLGIRLRRPAPTTGLRHVEMHRNMPGKAAVQLGIGAGQVPDLSMADGLSRGGVVAGLTD